MERRVIRAHEGEVLGPPDGCRDRFLVDAEHWGGHVGVLQHLLAPKANAAPMHRHTKEDEFSLILEGRVWFVADGEEHVAELGPSSSSRAVSVTFFNAADEPARLLEIISPGGLERAFRIIDAAAEDVDLGPIIEPYGCQGDIDATVPWIEKYGLTFG